MQNFILDFILPEIAWQMERNNEFYLRVQEIRKIIEPILTETDDISVCGEFGREIFTKYRSGASAKMYTYKIAKKILERLGDDITEVTESIINCCVFALGIMQESNGKYGFVHQHIRDYFAAVKNINTIRLSVYHYEENEKELALECINKIFKDEPVNYTVRRFMGEYLGEHRNKPYFANEKWNYGVPSEKCDQSLLKRVLDVYRGYFDGECGYGVYSVIQILKEIRQDLSGSVFSELDLSSVSFNGTITDDTGIPINVNESLMTKECFFCCGHNGFLHWAGYSPDGKYIISASEDYTAIISDALTGVTVSKLKGDSGGVRSANFSFDGKLVVTSSFDGTVIIWNVKKPREPLVINTLDCHIGCVDYVSFGFDTKHILTSSLQYPYVFVWNTEDLQNCFIEKKLIFQTQILLRYSIVLQKLNLNLIRFLVI